MSFILSITFSLIVLFVSGLSDQSVGIIKGALYPGYYYKIQLQVTIPGYTSSTVSVLGTMNYVPYGGICSLDKLSGKKPDRFSSK